ncbi:MAG: putative toxin-antitoxin system toxin component, PIN family [Arcicella sp.]|nr:putative toxin-antitoxin system toxin component, PIN family [Arcicella sp.]
MKIVIDTNLYISALINNNSRQRLEIILANKNFDILMSNALLQELTEVANRPKFRKYVSVEQSNTFILLMMERATFVETTSEIKASPDPKDDFLLILSLDGEADYLLTGNKIDLLDLKTFHKTQIITLSAFLAVYS